MFSKKVVYIGSVAQCGDRMPPLHWGEAGIRCREGGWCPDCGYDTVYTTASAKNRFISAVLSAQSRG